MGSAPLGDSRTNDRQVLAQALRDTAALLKIDASDAAEELGEIANAVRMYATDKEIAKSLGSPGGQKLLVKRLADTLNKALELTVQLSPEYHVQIEQLLGAKLTSASAQGSQCPMTYISTISEAVEEFLTRFNPTIGPGTNIALETAVRKLIPLMQTLANGQVTVSMNKNKDGGASLRSSEARAIGALLQSVDPELSLKMVATMIHKVQTKPVRSKPYISTICHVDPSKGLLGYLDPRPPAPTSR